MEVHMIYYVVQVVYADGTTGSRVYLLCAHENLQAQVEPLLPPGSLVTYIQLLGLIWP